MQVTKTVQFFLDGNGQPDARIWDGPAHLDACKTYLGTIISHLMETP